MFKHINMLVFLEIGIIICLYHEESLVWFYTIRLCIIFYTNHLLYEYDKYGWGRNHSRELLVIRQRNPNQNLLFWDINLELNNTKKSPLLSTPFHFCIQPIQNPTHSFEKAEELSTMAANAVNSTPLSLPLSIPTGKLNSSPTICLLTKPSIPTLSIHSTFSLSNNNFRFYSNFSLRPSSSLASGIEMLNHSSPYLLLLNLVFVILMLMVRKYETILGFLLEIEL